MAQVGRPTKYSDSINDEANSYVDKCILDSAVPFVEELALELGVNDDTLVEWTTKHQEFSATMERLKLLQKLRIQRGALEKRLQSNMAIFLLKANHGVNEKASEQVQTVIWKIVDSNTNEQQGMSIGGVVLPMLGYKEDPQIQQ